MSHANNLSSLGAEDYRRLESLLSDLVTEARVGCALLLDRDGRLLAAAGDAGDLDPVTFASLAAADFAASGQLAMHLGEAEFNTLYHEGNDRSMYLVDVSGTAILAALFDGRTTLGMVRLQTRRIVPALAAVFAGATGRGAGKEATLGQAWLEEAEGEIDRLFGR